MIRPLPPMGIESSAIAQLKCSATVRCVGRSGCSGSGLGSSLGNPYAGNSDPARCVVSGVNSY
jgi:hypothetical protein